MLTSYEILYNGRIYILSSLMAKLNWYINGVVFVVCMPSFTGFQFHISYIYINYEIKKNLVHL